MVPWPGRAAGRRFPTTSYVLGITALSSVYSVVVSTLYQDSRDRHTFVGARVVDEEVRVLARAQAEQLDDFALELEDGYAGTIEVDAAQLLGSLEMEYYIGSHAARCGGGMAEVVCPGGGEATKIWHGGWGGTMG